MRGVTVLVFCCALSVMALAQDATRSLTMTATTERTVLLARMPKNVTPATAMLQDIAPISLDITLTNTGTEPLVLNTFDFITSHLRVEISGPQENSISRMALLKERELRAPKPEDSVFLHVGESWTLPQAVHFPDAIGMTRFALRHFGDYRLRLHYVNLPRYQGAASTDWSGVASSEVIPLTVLETNEPVNGLQFALQAQPVASLGRNHFRFIAYVRNIGVTGLTIPAWNVQPNPLRLCATDKTEIPITPLPNDAVRKIANEEKYRIIPAGKQLTFSLPPGLLAYTGFAEPAEGFLQMSTAAGFAYGWPVRGQFAFADAVLETPAVLPKVEGQPPYWQGIIVSPLLKVDWDATEYHRTRLRARPELFAMHINYSGPQDKPYPALNIYTREPAVPVGQGIRVIISDEDALALIDHLAASGMLSHPLPLETAALAPPVDGYTLTITGGSALRIPLGWNLAMYHTLAALQTRLPQHARPRPVMSPLLERMSGEKNVWEVAEALRKPMDISLTAGTVEAMAEQLRAGINMQNLRIVIAVDLQPLHINAMDFSRTPAGDAFSHLASIIGAHAHQEGEVMYIQAIQLGR